jgi:photosystem II stability/assembly factor-like uncharacterized protein
MQVGARRKPSTGKTISLARAMRVGGGFEKTTPWRENPPGFSSVVSTGRVATLGLVRWARVLRVTWLLWTPYALGAAGVSGERDVLDRPALMSPRAKDATLLCVTRAQGRLVAVGERAIVLLSDDRGVTWRQAEVPVSVTLTSVDFPTAQKGWAVGHSGVVLHTEDGGTTWVKQLDGRQAAHLIGGSAQAALAAGGPTAPRQLALARRLIDEGPDKPFLDVYFADENRGFIVGAYGLVFATHDGGKTWLPWQDHLDNPEGRHLYSVRAGGNHLYVAGEQGTLYRSDDGGASFVRLESPYAGTLFGALPGERGTILVFGLRGHAYWSNDAGRTWHPSAVPSPSSLTGAVRLADGSIVVTSQEGEVLRSTDQGHRFRALPIPRQFPLTSAVQAADGRLVLSGIRGLSRAAVGPDPPR